MISSNTEGNRYHDEDGKFASAPNSSGAKTDDKKIKANTAFKKIATSASTPTSQSGMAAGSGPRKENPELKAKLKGTINMLEGYRGKPEGTYNLLTGEMVNLSDGFMVTFHQNEADENGHYKSHFGRYTSDEYDQTAYDFAMDNDAEVFVGVFDNEPEISFKVEAVSSVNAPVSRWDEAGRLRIFYNDEEVGSEKLFFREDIDRENKDLRNFYHKIKS